MKSKCVSIDEELMYISEKLEQFSLKTIEDMPRLENIRILLNNYQEERTGLQSQLNYISTLPKLVSTTINPRILSMELKEKIEILEIYIEKYQHAEEEYSELLTLSEYDVKQWFEPSYRILRAIHLIWPRFLEQMQPNIRQVFNNLIVAISFGAAYLYNRLDIILSEKRKFCGERGSMRIIQKEQDLEQCNFERPFELEAGGARNNAIQIYVYRILQ